MQTTSFFRVTSIHTVVKGEQQLQQRRRRGGSISTIKVLQPTQLYRYGHKVHFPQSAEGTLYAARYHIYCTILSALLLMCAVVQLLKWHCSPMNIDVATPIDQRPTSLIYSGRHDCIYSQHIYAVIFVVTVCTVIMMCCTNYDDIMVRCQLCESSINMTGYHDTL